MMEVPVYKPHYPSEIVLSQVDDNDFELVSKIKWSQQKSGSGLIYAAGSLHGKTILIHGLIMGFPVGKEIDHIDGNPLNNQRENLRVCTRGENSRNQKLQKNNKSGFKGVTWHKRIKKFQSNIRMNDKLIHIGYFKTAEDAARAYNAAALRYHVEYARLNKLPEPALV